VRGIRVWAGLLGLRRAVVDDVRMGIEGEVIVAVRPSWRERDRCGVCRRRRPGYDLGEGRRRWRALDLGTTFAFVEADAVRVTCRRHGVVVSAVPWARHDSRFTRAFEDQVCWLAVNCSKTAVAELMRPAWRSVGTILERVAAEAMREGDLLDGLRRMGIDEISHRKGQRYLTVVVDHHTGRLVWAAPSRDSQTVLGFFDALGPERCTQLELISADTAAWISRPIAERAPQADRCVDPFHVIMLATDALAQVRREVWNEARRQGNLQLVRDLKGARFAVGKTQRTSPTARPPSLPPSNRPTPGSTAPTCSKSNCARFISSPLRPPSGSWTAGWPGRADHDCRHSSSSPARSPTSEPESSPRSTTGSPTPGSSRSTPRSG
jgi:transposase